MATVLVISDSLVTAKGSTVTRTISEVQRQLAIDCTWLFDGLFQFNTSYSLHNAYTTATIEAFSRLRARIIAAQPDCILICGDLLTDLFFSQSVDATHNLVKRFNGIPVICTYHPSTLFKKHNDTFDPLDDSAGDDWPFWFSKSIEKAARIAFSPSVLTLPRHLDIKNTMSTVVNAKLAHEKSDLVCMDIETAYSDLSVRSIALSFDGVSAFCVSREDTDQLTWDEWFSFCRSLFESPSTVIIGHYFTNFDANVLNRLYGWQLRAAVWNTHTVQNLLNPETPKSLLDLARIHLFVSDWKGGHTASGPELREYNATDVINNFRCFESQYKLLSSLPAYTAFTTEPAYASLLQYYTAIVQPMEKIAFQTQSNGLTVDLTERQKMIERLSLEITALEQKLNPMLATACTLQHIQENDQRWTGSLDTGGKKLTTPLVKKLVDPLAYVVSPKMATEFGFTAGEIRIKSMGYKLSPNNVKQFLAKNKVKLPTTKKTKDERGESTNEKALKQILFRKNEKQEVKTFIEHVLLLREYLKFYGTYAAKPLDIHPDGVARWRSINVIGGTKTERSASRGMLIGSRPIVNKKTKRFERYESIEVGGNIQNFPRADSSSLFAFQSIFIPPSPHHTWLSFDWSAAEAYVGCWLTEDWAKEQSMLAGADIHSATASSIFGFDVAALKTTDPKRYKKCRHVGKTYNYSGLYGSSYKNMYEMFIKDGIQVSLDEVQSTYAAFHSLNPGITQFFHRRVQDQLKRDKTLYSYLGRRRTFLKPLKIQNHRGEWVDNDNLFREAYNYIPQATVGGMTHLVAAQSLSLLPQWTIVCEKHDQLIGFVERTQLAETTEKLKSILSSITVPVITTGGERLEKRIPFEVSSGDRWSEL